MADPDANGTAGMPRWVKLFAIVAILFVVAFVILHVTGLAPHGH
jgi:hypothetical protein